MNKSCRTYKAVTEADVEVGDVSLIDRIRARRKAWTVDELSELLSMSNKAIYSMCKAGRLPHIRIGQSIRFDGFEIGKWLDSRAA
jgi:excisionase family DNA binding protein